MTTFTLPINNKSQRPLLYRRQRNAINADCAAIISGSGNTVNHLASAVFGSNIATVAANTFHANNYAAMNMPLGPGAAGTFYTVFSALLGSNVVMIS